MPRRAPLTTVSKIPRAAAGSEIQRRELRPVWKFQVDNEALLGNQRSTMSFEARHNFATNSTDNHHDAVSGREARVYASAQSPSKASREARVYASAQPPVSGAAWNFTTDFTTDGAYFESPSKASREARVYASEPQVALARCPGRDVCFETSTRGEAETEQPQGESAGVRSIEERASEDDLELATQPPVVLRSMEIVGTPNDAHGIQFSDGDTVTTPSTFATPPCAVSVGRASNNRVCWFDGSPSPTSDVESVTNSRVAFPALNIVWTKEREGVEQNDETQLSAVQNVYKYMHTQASDHLSCDGGDTNAWLTRASVAKLILFLQQQGCLCRESVFLDGGCSYNVLASHVAQVVGCKVWGVEYVTTRCFMAATNMLRALKDPHNVGALVNPKIALVPSDLLAMTSFEPSTLGYFFDEAFNLDLIQHICDVAAASPSIK